MNSFFFRSYSENIFSFVRYVFWNDHGLGYSIGAAKSLKTGEYYYYSKY